MNPAFRGRHLLRRSGVASSAFVLALALAAIAAGQARAAFPGTNGKIVFETNRDGNEEIYTMHADGTNRVPAEARGPMAAKTRAIHIAAANADLLDWKNSVLKSFYREETLRSDLARATFLFPDVAS